MENIWTKINESIEIYFKDIIKCYNMKVVKISPLKTAMVQREFALIISVDRFSADVSYLIREKEDNNLKLLPCGNFFAEKFTCEDRRDLLQGDTAENMVINNLIVINNGLKNNWSDVLEGNVSWIADYEKSKWYEIVSLNMEEEKLLSQYI
ncbi:MAG: hypothetical protein RR538_09395 [Erysipelotrichaceae bacterium]